MELSAGCASPGVPIGDATSPPGEPAGPPEIVEWTIDPWRESRWRAALAAAAALLLCCFALWLLRGSGIAGPLLGLAVLGALAPAMAPMRCRVDADGVARRVLFAWERRAWPQIRRARCGREGLFVSPRGRPGRLDAFRGLFLPVPRRAAERDGLLARLRREVGRHGLL